MVVRHAGYTRCGVVGCALLCALLSGQRAGHAEESAPGFWAKSETAPHWDAKTKKFNPEPEFKTGANSSAAFVTGKDSTGDVTATAAVVRSEDDTPTGTPPDTPTTTDGVKSHYPHVKALPQKVLEAISNFGRFTDDDDAPPAQTNAVPTAEAEIEGTYKQTYVWHFSGTSSGTPSATFDINVTGQVGVTASGDGDGSGVASVTIDHEGTPVSMPISTTGGDPVPLPATVTITVPTAPGIYSFDVTATLSAHAIAKNDVGRRTFKAHASVTLGKTTTEDF